ncbi:DUF411 domain-containing protein [Methylomicrobium lacus]|uniref:DUF411 domain-containing protein n=1 Tax=Methylomicrobium lacus TaxID=136992 RepID=UPI0035A8C653
MKAMQIGALVTVLFASAGYAADAPVDITVYRSSTCGCCGKWIDHLKQNNFNVKDNVSDDMEAIKSQYGVPKEMASCHTAVVNGYVVEGHVPAADIIKLLKDKPKVTGLAVPGMVTGSPGMEMGGHVDPYDVMSFDKEKHFQIFNHYEGK